MKRKKWMPKGKYYSQETVTLAKQTARGMIKRAIKDKGMKVSNVPSKFLDKASITVLLHYPSILKQADKEVEQ